MSIPRGNVVTLKAGGDKYLGIEGRRIIVKEPVEEIEADDDDLLDKSSSSPHESGHVTRRKTNATIRKPKKLDPSSLSARLPLSHAASTTISITSSALNPNAGTTRKISITSSASPNPSLRLTLGPVNPLPTQTLSLHLSAKPRIKPSLPVSESHVSKRAGSASHPRDLVPLDIGFPPSNMEDKIKPEDKEDRLLMATCAVIHANENRALCPKEIAELMHQRGWLHNAGTTPFAHISTCIRAHLRRCNATVPPCESLVTSFELLGALTPSEIRAVGLRADERPAVKRGTLWYLNERVLGSGVGADDPFIRCGREAGIENLSDGGKYVRAVPVPPPSVPSASLPKSPTLKMETNEVMVIDEEEEDTTGMGRGKRKRRISSAAALSNLPLLLSLASTSHSFPATTSPFPATSNRPWNAPSHRRHSSGSASTSLPKTNSIPRLRLRLTNLEEVDSTEDSAEEEDGGVSARRSTKKKVRRATSEGVITLIGGASAGPLDTEVNHAFDGSEDDEVDDAIALRSAFSSASSSALLAQSLHAVSIAPSPSIPLQPSPHSVVAPGSIHLASGPFQHRPTPISSASAPNLFSGFSSAQSPDRMEVDYDREMSEERQESGGEEDFHEAMLRGEDFDFEWGSESFDATGMVLPSFSQRLKGKAREESVEVHTKVVLSEEMAQVEELPNDEEEEEDEEGNVNDEDDDSSTPATTPRSPPPGDDVDLNQEQKGGMEETLCEAFEDELDLVDVDLISDVPVDRVASSDSIVSLILADDEPRVEDDIPTLPSSIGRLSLESDAPLLSLPPLLSLESLQLLVPNAADYDFVGTEYDPSMSGSRYGDHDGEDSGDEDEEGEDEDVDTISVKCEDDDSSPMIDSSSSFRPSPAYRNAFISRANARALRNESVSSGSSEESDNFNPHMIIPPPPDTVDWEISVDNDELDTENNSMIDLLGPESVGLEELDLAWGGSQAEDETEEDWRSRAHTRVQSRSRHGEPERMFLTRSPTEGSSSLALARLALPPIIRSPLPLPSPVINVNVISALPTSLVSPRPHDTRSVRPPRTSATYSTSKSSCASVVVYPKLPLFPTVTATIIQRGIAVFQTTITDIDKSPHTLIRRIDNDYVNGTVFLLQSSSSSSSSDHLLSTIPDTFSVTTGGRGVEGVWIPLSAARSLAEANSELSTLLEFLGDGLGSKFPSPIPTMRDELKMQSDAAIPPRSTSIIGQPPFYSAQINLDPSTESLSLDSAPSSPPVIVIKKGRRRSEVSAAGGGSSGDLEEIGVRKSKRAVVPPKGFDE